MSSRIPRPTNEWSAAHRRQETIARFQQLEGKITITAEFPGDTGGSGSAQVWNIVEFAEANGLGATVWPDVFSALQGVDSFSDGDEIFFPAGVYDALTEGFVVTRSLRISGRGATITSASNVPLINVQADNVVIEDLILQGVTANTYAVTGIGVESNGGSATDRRSKLTIRNCQFYDFAASAIECEFVNRIVIEDCHIDRYARNGIQLLSVSHFRIEGNLIENGMNGAGNPSARVYPIMMSRQTVDTIAVFPRTTDGIVRNNVIVNNPWWEGIDTHSGQRLLIEGNFLFNVDQPIAIVSSSNELGVDSYAASDIIVRGNYMDSLRDDGGAKSGIVVDGAGTVTGTVAEYASNIVVQGNMVRRHGMQSNSLMGGIAFFRTRSIAVNGNSIDQCSPYGINGSNDNDGFAVTGNTICDSWTAALACGPFSFASFYNRGVVDGNVVVRGNKTAANVNERGINTTTSVDPLTHNNRIILGINDFDDVPANNVVKGSGSLSNPGGSVKFGFYNKYMNQPTITATALSGASTMADVTAVVNSIRTALKDNLGLAL